MVNINCSEYCKYEVNGKCCLTHITLSSSFIGYDTNCAYFHPKNPPCTKYTRHI